MIGKVGSVTHIPKMQKNPPKKNHIEDVEFTKLLEEIDISKSNIPLPNNVGKTSVPLYPFAQCVGKTWVWLE